MENAGHVPRLAIRPARSLTGYDWNEQRIGFAPTAGGIAGIPAQTPAGALVALRGIASANIDYAAACGAEGQKRDAEPAGGTTLLKDRPLVVFLICAVMFHFANMAMLPPLGETTSGSTWVSSSSAWLRWQLSQSCIFRCLRRAIKTV
jgi:hypothetical protein